MIKFAARLPLCASLALLLTLGCGDSADDDDADDDGAAGSIDVSSARVERVAKANCARDAMCDPEEFASEHSSVAECTESALDSVQRPTAAQRKCADATLDAAECFAEVPCDDDPDDACGDLKAAFQAACD